MKQTQHSKLLELGNSNSEVYYALKWNFLGNDFQGEHIITLQIFWGIYPQIHYVEFGSQPPAKFSIKSMTTLEVQNKITFLCNIAKFSLILNLKPYRFWIVFPPVKRIRAEFCRGKNSLFPSFPILNCLSPFPVVPHITFRGGHGSSFQSWGLTTQIIAQVTARELLFANDCF